MTLDKFSKIVPLTDKYTAKTEREAEAEAWIDSLGGARVRDGGRREGDRRDRGQTQHCRQHGPVIPAARVREERHQPAVEREARGVVVHAKSDSSLSSSRKYT